MKHMALILTIIYALNGPYIPNNYPPKPAEGANGPMQPKGNL